MIAWHPVGELVICVAIVSGEPDPASGLHWYILPSLEQQKTKCSPQLSNEK